MTATEICNNAMACVIGYPPGTQITHKEILVFLRGPKWRGKGDMKMQFKAKLIGEVYLKYARLKDKTGNVVKI